MDDQGAENVDRTRELELKIEEVTRVLKLASAFQAELHDSDVRGIDYLREMVQGLEERLRSLKALQIANAWEKD